MALSAGTRLGPFTVGDLVGAGGMGEVYRARDTRLDRTVAIKVLPAHLSADPERRQRFRHEARAISSLSHPHVCALYDVGEHEGVDYLVMEYLEGETLASRLLRGPLGTPELLRCGIQIADALQAAHRQGLVHRDLKPGNVMLTRDGARLLDFGLADRQALIQPAEEATAEPTLTLAAAGAVAGTLRYMAPEQLAGRADARSDLFAFGAMLHEMATGRRAFDGDKTSGVVGAILRDQPPPASSLRPALPAGVDRIIAGCLAKEPEDRWQSAHDVRMHLEWIAAGEAATAKRPVGGWPSRALAAAALAGAAVAALTLVLWDRPGAAPQEPLRLQIDLPEGVADYRLPRISPDGRYVAFRGSEADGLARIWVRALDEETARALPGTEGAWQPFWSPDSRSLGFFADRALKRVDVEGGGALTLAESAGFDGTWSARGVILFDGDGGVMSVSTRGEGATPQPVRQAGGEHAPTGWWPGWPEFLPDGRHFLYTWTDGARRMLHVGDLDSAQDVELGPVDSRVEYAWPGYLLYLRDTSLVAQPFDAAALRITGEPVALLEDMFGKNGTGHFSASRTGVLVARRGPLADSRRLQWVDRDGTSREGLPESGSYFSAALSPRGDRIAVTVEDSETTLRDVWVHDVTRGVLSRLTVEPGSAGQPIWSPDGERLLYSARRAGIWGFYLTRVTGGGPAEPLLETQTPMTAWSWSRDGRQLLYQQWDPVTDWDLWLLDLAGEPEPRALLRTPFREGHASFSPDARHAAYESNESGRPQIYVAEVPSLEQKLQVSPDGGTEPLWTRDGRTILYLSSAGLVSVGVSSTEPLRVEKPQLISHLLPPPAVHGFTLFTRYTLSPDGRRVLLVAPELPGQVPPISVYVNWSRWLER